jgi:hypothetical protein
MHFPPPTGFHHRVHRGHREEYTFVLTLRWGVEMRNWVVACLVAMLTAGAGVFAQTKDVEIAYQKFVLDNGLTLIVHEDHKDVRRERPCQG